MWGHSLLKAGNLFGLTAYMPLIMKWGVAKIWDLILGHFWVNLSKNHDFCQKWRKIRGLLYAFSVKNVQPIITNFIYATEYGMECCQNLRLDFGSFCPKIMFFAKDEEKQRPTLGMPTLLKDDNIFIITVYMPLTMKWGDT